MTSQSKLITRPPPSIYITLWFSLVSERAAPLLFRKLNFALATGLFLSFFICKAWSVGGFCRCSASEKTPCCPARFMTKMRLFVTQISTWELLRTAPIVRPIIYQLNWPGCLIGDRCWTAKVIIFAQLICIGDNWLRMEICIYWRTPRKLKSVQIKINFKQG